MVVIDESVEIDAELSTVQTMEEPSDPVKLESHQFRVISKKILDTFRKISFVLMRRRTGKDRTFVWLLLFCNFLFIGCEYGKRSEQSLYRSSQIKIISSRDRKSIFFRPNKTELGSLR